MKEFYHSSIGCNTAVIQCRNNNAVFNLHYHLYNNPVQHIWQSIHTAGAGIKTSNLATKTLETLLQDLKQCCDDVGVSMPSTVDQQYLNKLHNDYVLSNKSNSWYKINDLIHAVEGKISNPFRDYDLSIGFYSLQEQYIPIKEEYKIFLDTDIKWGRLDLGYGTLGKDWIDISKNNDSVDDFSLQTTISSETIMSFCVEPGVIGVNAARFYNWSKDKDNIPFNHLNNLALGRYPLGQLIITDTLLSFHSNPSDWYVPNHRCKLAWNKEIFNASTEVLNISYENTDMLYNSFVKHSDAAGILNV